MSSSDTTPQPPAPEPVDHADAAPPAVDPRRVLAARRIRLLESNLYLVIGPREGLDLGRVISEAIEGGVDIVQLRAKDASDAELLTIGPPIAEYCHEHRVMLILNDRADLVNAIGADGVHVGQDDLSVAEAREIVGPACLVGVSTHSAEQLAKAAEDEADYAGVGPVFTTPTKPGRAATGYRYVHHAGLHAELPWFAIGGIDATNAPRVLETGAERIAVVRAIADADDPRAAAKELKTLINGRARRQSSEEKDAAARAELKPFEPGERPPVAAFAATLVAGIALANLLLLAWGYQPRYNWRNPTHEALQLGFGIGAVILSFFVWRLKAWALLLLEAVLGITMLFSFAGLVLSGSFLSALISVIVLAGSAVLFYRLIRVLARAQIPADRPASGT